MSSWSGMIECGDLRIDAVVSCYKTGEIFSAWSGSGRTNQLCELRDEFLTNVGKIFISRQSPDDPFHVEFRGTGVIMGPLAAAMESGGIQ